MHARYSLINIPRLLKAIKAVRRPGNEAMHDVFSLNREEIAIILYCMLNSSQVAAIICDMLRHPGFSYQ